MRTGHYFSTRATLSRRLLLPAVVLCVAVATAVADDPQIVRLTVDAASKPQPALRYRLIPAEHTLREGNAAALYYRALLQLLTAGSSRSELNEQQVELSEWLELPLAEFPREKARELLKQYAYVLDEARIGARRSAAVWDIPLEEGGIHTLLPEIQEIRSIARLLKLQARLALVEGDFDQALDSLNTLFAMGRHVGQSGPLISSLVGAAICGTGLDEVGTWIGTPGAPNLYWALTALPAPMISLRDGIRSERYWIVSTLPYLDVIESTVLSDRQARELLSAVADLFSEVEADDPVARALFGQVPGLPAAGRILLPALNTYSAAKRHLIQEGFDAALVEEMPVAQVVVLVWVKGYRDVLDEMVAWADRPDAERRVALSEIDERLAETQRRPENLLGHIALPAAGAACNAESRLAHWITILRVVEAVRLYAAAHDGQLPSSLADIVEVSIPLDPVTSQPFEYRLEAQTAIVRSPAPRLVGGDYQYELTIRSEN